MRAARVMIVASSEKRIGVRVRRGSLSALLGHGARVSFAECHLFCTLQARSEIDMSETSPFPFGNIRHFDTEIHFALTGLEGITVVKIASPSPWFTVRSPFFRHSSTKGTGPRVRHLCPHGSCTTLSLAVNRDTLILFLWRRTRFLRFSSTSLRDFARTAMSFMWKISCIILLRRSQLVLSFLLEAFSHVKVTFKPSGRCVERHLKYLSWVLKHLVPGRGTFPDECVLTELRIDLIR